MPSERLGVQVQTGSKIEGTVNANQSVNNYSYSNTTNNLPVGYYPNATDHDASSEYRENYTNVLENLKALIESGKKSTSNRQNLFLIHGPVCTGKSTAARLLMTDKDLDSVNRIWIDADTSEKLVQDFRQLYERMKALKYPVPSEQKVFKELLNCLYRNLFTEPTLIIFDSAAVVDIDPNSVFKEASNLLTYLIALRSTSLTPGVVSPTVVITTRAVYGPRETHSFSLLPLNRSSCTFSVNEVDEDRVWKPLHVDLLLIRNHSHGKLASLQFLLILLSGKYKIPVQMLNYLSRQFSERETLSALSLSSSVSEDDVQVALKLLECFYVIEITNGFVCLTVEIKKNFEKILEAAAMLEITNLVPLVIEATVYPIKDVQLFNMDLKEIDSWANSLSMIICNLYPYLLKNEVTPMDMLVFDHFGINFERRIDLLTANVTNNPSSQVTDYAIKLQSFSHLLMEWARFALGGCTKANLSFQKQNFYLIAKSMMYQGSIKYTVEDCFEEDSDQSTYAIKMDQAECHLKLGNLDQAFTLSCNVDEPAHYGYLLYEPSKVIQAKILKSQGKHLQARVLLQTSLEKTIQVCGANSCATASVKCVLAKAEALNRKFDAAIKLIDQVIAVRRQFLGVTTVRYIETIATKAKILTLRGDYQKAQDCVSTAQKDFIAKKRYVYADGSVEDHPHFLILRYHQAKLFYHQQLFPEALKELEALQHLFGETNVYWFKCQLIKARVLLNDANLNESKEVLKMMIKQAEGVFQGADNHQALKFKLAYAENLILQGKFKKAKKAAKTLLQNASSHAISLRLRAKCILARILKFETNVKVVPALKELVDESIKWCGPFHTQTLKFKLQLLEELVRIPNQQVSEIDDLINPVLQFLEAASYKSASETLLSWQCLQASKLVQYNRLTLAEALISKLEPLVNGRSVLSVQLKYSKAVLKSRQGHHQSVYTNSATELLHLVTRSQALFLEPDSAEVTAFLAYLWMKLERRQKSPEAVNLCLSSLAILARTYCYDHARMKQAKLNLAIAYGVSGSCSKALELVDEVQPASGREDGVEAKVLRDAMSAPILDPGCLEYYIGGRIKYIEER